MKKLSLFLLLFISAVPLHPMHEGEVDPTVDSTSETNSQNNGNPENNDDIENNYGSMDEPGSSGTAQTKNSGFFQRIRSFFSVGRSNSSSVDTAGQDTGVSTSVNTSDDPSLVDQTQDAADSATRGLKLTAEIDNEGNIKYEGTYNTYKRHWWSRPQEYREYDQMLALDEKRKELEKAAQLKLQHDKQWYADVKKINDLHVQLQNDAQNIVNNGTNYGFFTGSVSRSPQAKRALDIIKNVNNSWSGSTDNRTGFFDQLEAYRKEKGITTDLATDYNELYNHASLLRYENRRNLRNGSQTTPADDNSESITEDTGNFDEELKKYQALRDKRSLLTHLNIKNERIGSQPTPADTVDLEEYSKAHLALRDKELFLSHLRRENDAGNYTKKDQEPKLKADIERMKDDMKTKYPGLYRDRIKGLKDEIENMEKNYPGLSPEKIEALKQKIEEIRKDMRFEYGYMPRSPFAW